jgi:hypothetical protein
MSLLIILRKHLTPNRFNQLLLGALDTGEGDNAIICSGFFQENGFSASFSTGLSTILNNHNIRLTTFGVYSYGTWLAQYRMFRDNLINNGNTIIAKRTAKLRWHAKIFILKHGNDPIFGIIGSSNMTGSAFGITTTFNYEADVVLWDGNFQLINSLCQFQTNLQEEGLDDIIYADDNLERNRYKTSMDRLRDMEKELDLKNQPEL